MTWDTIALLIVEVGLPAADYIVTKWTAKGQVTVEEFAELKFLANQHGEDRMKAMLTQAGIPLDDPKAIALLNLTKSTTP